MKEEKYEYIDWPVDITKIVIPKKNYLQNDIHLSLTHQVRIKIKNVEFDIFVFNGLSVVKI